MKLKRLGIAAAIMSTFGFSCYNEPNYPREGMSNSPVGSGSGIASITYGGPPAGAAAAVSPAAASQPAANKGAAKKGP